MAKFFVGHRVRVAWVRDQANSHLVGLSGVINEIRREKHWEWSVIGLDTFPISRCFDVNRFVTVGFRAEQLEPILPEGAQPLGYSFEQMMSEFGVTEAVK